MRCAVTTLGCEHAKHMMMRIKKKVILVIAVLSFFSKPSQYLKLCQGISISNSYTPCRTPFRPKGPRRTSSSMLSLKCVSKSMNVVIWFPDELIFIVGSGHQSPGLWRHPDDQSWRFNEVSHWVELAKILEEAKFHGIFIADVLGKLESR